MDLKHLKQHIYENDLIINVLEELGMHHIRWHGNREYITCGVPDGDNTSSTTIYNSEHLNVVAYTRDIKDVFGNSDIISLTCFIHKCYFSTAIKILCEIAGLDYYADPEAELPESIRWTKNLLKMSADIDEEEEIPLKPIDETILSYYTQRPIVQWALTDGISLETQEEFEIGFDLRTERITIPIRDDLNNLVGIKGRLYLQDDSELRPKYLYLEKCPKSYIVFGIYKSLPYIKRKGFVIVCESEKGTMQLHSQGYKNAVSIGGSSFSKTQVEKITRLNTDVVIAFDKDVSEEDVLKECGKFIDCVNISYLLDRQGLLEDKESPMDKAEKFKKLIENSMYKYIR